MLACTHITASEALCILNQGLSTSQIQFAWAIGFHHRCPSLAMLEPSGKSAVAGTVMGQKWCKGSCLCGAVRFEVAGPIQWMTHCHCSMCRKHHGTLFGTTVGIANDNFRWLQGEDDIVHYRASAAFERPFCEHCGSDVPDTSGTVVVCPVGTLEDDLGERPRAHIFVGSKSPMCEIHDDLRQFDEYPPGYGNAIAPPQHSQGVQRSNAPVHGSCLCGEVAFEIERAPRKMLNCHCTRCQRSRGTAFGTNVFAKKDWLRWTRGADQLTTWRFPGAALFSTGFCNRCGSLMPSLFEAMGNYIVPVGSLDTALVVKPGAHIYTSTKAAWLDLNDGLPQFEELPPRERLRDYFF